MSELGWSPRCLGKTKIIVDFGRKDEVLRSTSKKMGANSGCRTNDDDVVIYRRMTDIKDYRCYEETHLTP